jgi:hypothetical protein
MERKPYRCWVCDEIIWRRSDESVCEQCGRNHVAQMIMEARAVGDRELAKEISNGFWGIAKAPEGQGQ